MNGVRRMQEQARGACRGKRCDELAGDEAGFAHAADYQAPLGGQDQVDGLAVAFIDLLSQTRDGHGLALDRLARVQDTMVPVFPARDFKATWS